jgi:hypothetical protein
MEFTSTGVGVQIVAINDVLCRIRQRWGQPPTLDSSQ